MSPISVSKAWPSSLQQLHNIRHIALQTPLCLYVVYETGVTGHLLVWDNQKEERSLPVLMSCVLE